LLRNLLNHGHSEFRGDPGLWQTCISAQSAKPGPPESNAREEVCVGLLPQGESAPPATALDHQRDHPIPRLTCGNREERP